MSGTGAVREDETALLERLRAGDEGAFLALVGRHHAALVRFARAFVRTPEAAEEVAQETWCALLDRLGTFEQRASLKSFLYGIASNQARTRAKRDGRTTALSELEGETETSLVDRFDAGGRWATPPAPWTAETPAALLERREAMAALGAALERLPPRQRTVVELRDVEGLDAEEVCELLGVSEVHQRVLLHRARTKLRAELEEHFRG